MKGINTQVDPGVSVCMCRWGVRVELWSLFLCFVFEFEQTDNHILC